MTNIKAVYERLRATPRPRLANSVGDFALYESLLAGCADRIARGGLLDITKVPIPDDETLAHVELLRKKGELLAEETAFLEYFDLLEQIRRALGGGN